MMRINDDDILLHPCLSLSVAGSEFNSWKIFNPQVDTQAFRPTPGYLRVEPSQV
jgi:hypothetical protein